MERIATNTSRVAHIPAGVMDGADGRTVSTVCGKTFAESELVVNNDLNECKACNNKFESITNSVSDVELP